MKNETQNGSSNGGLIFDEIVDVPALVAKLRSSSNRLCAYLMESFSAAGRDAIATDGAAASDKLKPVLAAELARVIKSAGLYDKTRFADFTLQPMTLGVLGKKPKGLDLIWSNTLLLRDAFRDELACKADTLAAEWVANGVNFTVYCQTRRGSKRIGISYQIVFKTLKKWDSRHAKTLELAKGMLNDIADEILSGTVPANKEDAKARHAKAKAYDQVAKEVAKTGKTAEEDVLDFIRDAVKAQLELGPTRPLLKFVQEAIEVMPKPVQRMLLKVAFLSYKAFNKTRQGVGKKEKQQKLNVVERFVSEIPVCEKLAEKLVLENRLSGDLKKDDLVIKQLLVEGLAPEKPAPQEVKSPDIYGDDVTALGILLWLRLLGVEWKFRRDCLDYLRNFYKYLRDALHAVPQVTKTVAHVVPRPRREGKKQPVAILWFTDVWRILINLQDLESVFFVAIGVFAGLHETEILRLIWRDIKWKMGEPYQIFVPSGKGKERRGAREGKYVDVRFPLTKILLLGKGRKGSIVTNKSIWRVKLSPLVKRLKIVWSQSIMRHTCASYLNGIGLPLEEVARQLRDLASTVALFYILQLSKLEAEPFWTSPVDVSLFAKLPNRRRFWDKKAPLKSFAAPGTSAPDPAAESAPEGALECSAADASAENQSVQPEPRTRRKRLKGRYPWPPILEFLVLLWDKTQKEIAEIFGCRPTSVSAHAARLDLDTPDAEYWRLKKLGLSVEVPESVKQARLLLQAAAHAAEAAVNGKSPAPSQPQSPVSIAAQEQNPPTEGPGIGPMPGGQESIPKINL